MVDREIPNTPEEMFPIDFDVYTTEDAARDILRTGATLDAAELIVGPAEPLGEATIVRKNKVQKALSYLSLKYTISKMNAARRRGTG